jgi:hypothetical protein
VSTSRRLRANCAQFHAAYSPVKSLSLRARWLPGWRTTLSPSTKWKVSLGESSDIRQPLMACSACIRSVAIIETPTIVKPMSSRGTHERGNVQQSWPGWLRPEPRLAMADSMLKP